MFGNFDLNPKTQHLAIQCIEFDGRQWIQLQTLDGRALGEIDYRILPLRPRWSPDGQRLAFASNDGLLYIRELTGSSQDVFEDRALRAGFCEWFGDSRLVFSAYTRYAKQPPDIYCFDLDSRQTAKLTSGEDFVDRFPQPFLQAL